MSGDNDVEPMDYENQDPPVGVLVSLQDEEKVLLTLSLKWLNNKRPPKLKRDVELLLQSWFNNSDKKSDCRLVKVFNDETFQIELKPDPGVARLQKLCGQTLKVKKSEAAATISSIYLTPSALGELPEDASMNSSLPVYEAQVCREQPGAQRQPGAQEQPGAQRQPGAQEQPGAQKQPEAQEQPSAQWQPGAQRQPAAQEQPEALNSSVSTAEENMVGGIIPVSQYWYLTQIYKKELEQIKRTNRVEMAENLKVSFQAEKDGDPQNAFNEFTNLVLSLDITSSVVPLKYFDSDQWKEVLNTIKRKDQKLFLYLVSDQLVVFGPPASCDAVSDLLNGEPQTLAPISDGEYEGAPQDASLTIKMTIKDPLVEEGLSVEESCWKLMTTSFLQKIDDIKTKFNVDFIEAVAAPGRVTVKAFYNEAEENVSMESHAIRALLRLYQKTATLPMSLNQRLMKNMNGGHKSDGSSMDFEIIGGPEEGSGFGAAAAAADDKEDNCPICKDVFNDKKQLKCKHEFCKDCLQQAEESMGPVCPVCREVFGTIKGDQPEGTMTSRTIYSPLPGFPDCNTIEIIYHIPGGIQTDKHPNPGQQYSAIMRHAYLPDNKEGREVLHLLDRAFHQKLIFTVGMSRTTGAENQVTWNDIHHKTSMSGGPESYGYPDPNYLSRVKNELKAKGIK